MNYEYDIQYQSPLGTGKGRFVFGESAAGIQGKLTVFNKTFILENGKKEDNRFSFQGKIVFMGAQIYYEVSGIINANALNAKVHTLIGDITATGELRA